MSVRQDLRLALEDFLYEYKNAIIMHLENNVACSDYTDCPDCGTGVYVGEPGETVEAAEAIIKLIVDDVHNQEQLVHLTMAGDLAWNLLNNTKQVSAAGHKQFDDAMKGLS